MENARFFTASAQDVVNKLTEVSAKLDSIHELYASNTELTAALNLVSGHLSSITDALPTYANVGALISDLTSTMRLVEADAAGSWSLNKATDIMSLYDVDGICVAKFHILDTESIAHKERRMDLEGE